MAAAVLACLLACPGPASFGQDREDELVVRPPPPALDDFETDANKDGVPDGWYNLRDGTIVAEGGAVGPHFMRFEADKPGRGARLSRAFGVDGKKYEALVMGLWVRIERVQSGERLGEEPGLLVEFFGDKLRTATRGTMGPWNLRTFRDQGGSRWVRIAKRFPIPPSSKDAIMTVGLLGATGVLDVDGLTVELIPVGGTATNNLVKNGDFELGDPEPFGWSAENGARRASPGYRSADALELARSGAICMSGLALPVANYAALEISLKVRASGLRGVRGASAYVFFLDDFGQELPRPLGSAQAFSWAGTFPWQDDRAVVQVPNGAVRAVLQFGKADGIGQIWFDDVVVNASPDPQAGTWTPYHVDDETDGWLPIPASKQVEPKSALDFSFLLDGPAGKHGPLMVRNGRFHFTRGGTRARFLGVQLLPPAAFVDKARADAMADHLARSGVNLVRIGDLDTPLGPGRSLIDDSRDDTMEPDPTALEKFDHLIAALKARGIYVALELQGGRRFRSEDGVANPGALPPGGGPAAVFDAGLTRRALETARALLTHVNPETGVALKDEPALAWVTLAGEVTLFDQIDNPLAVPSDYAGALKSQAARSTSGSARRFWLGLESAHWKEMADALRKEGLKAPVAGVSHWRREKEFAEAQAASGLDLIDDRIFWAAPSWIAPRWRSMLWSLDGGLIPDANRKRRPDRPYVLGQWCDYTQGVWASPYEAAEQLLGARTAETQDWDALVRRGLFIHPVEWGASAPGTGGGEDIFQVPEVANAAPHVFALWPHAASILLRGQGTPASATDAAKSKVRAEPTRAGGRPGRHGLPGWEPGRGRLVVETPYTQGVAGWAGGEPVSLEQLTFDVENTYAVVVSSSAGDEPLSRSKRLLVTAVARVEPTGFRWVDDWRRETADPGQPPLRQEPVTARVLWKRQGTVKAYALDNNGARVKPAKVEKSSEGTRLIIEGTDPSLHWEMVVE
jgi:hypothetical protein